MTGTRLLNKQATRPYREVDGKTNRATWAGPVVTGRAGGVVGVLPVVRGFGGTVTKVAKKRSK